MPCRMDFRWRSRRRNRDDRLRRRSSILPALQDAARVPGELAGVVTETVAVPTIGIGAGPKCDGQVLVVNDVLGLFEKFTPSFVKKYLDLAPHIRKAVETFRDEVEQGAFPAQEHTFGSSIDFSSLMKGKK